MPGLCTGWNASAGFRTWRFTGCSAARAIALELRRVAHLSASPAYWIFSAVTSIVTARPGELTIHVRVPWRRFPYALTTVAAAPRNVPGPFRVLRASADAVTLRGSGKTLVFRRLSGLRALRAFRLGRLDEAPVPLGDVGRFRVRSLELRVRALLAQDLLVFRSGAVSDAIRSAYWQTADRADYAALVAEDDTKAALSLATSGVKPDPAAFRKALRDIPDLPSRSTSIAVPADPALQYGARILYGRWREVGLGTQLVAGNTAADADLRRIVAAYPQNEALLGALGLPTALDEVQQASAFDRVDARLRTDASVVPICWVVDARLVSRALTGWREDGVGNVDYTRVGLRY